MDGSRGGSKMSWRCLGRAQDTRYGVNTQMPLEHNLYQMLSLLKSFQLQSYKVLEQLMKNDYKLEYLLFNVIVVDSP